MTKIQWTDVTWNPTTGCNKVSPGCKNCYAERLWPKVYGRTGRAFTDVQFHPERLAQPLRWRKPRMVFVDSMSDLFHEDLTNEQIATVFGVMAAASSHTFQVLTKRPMRMVEWFRWAKRLPNVGETYRQGAPVTGYLGEYAIRSTSGKCNIWRENIELPDWPLLNVWLGVSVEDQPSANERIPLLLQTPAAVRFVSAEPLLGAVDASGYLGRAARKCCACGLRYGHDAAVGGSGCRGLDWIICGGESGPKARIMNAVWAEQLLMQCKDAGVPFFMKQMSGKAPIPDDLMVREWPATPNSEAQS